MKVRSALICLVLGLAIPFLLLLAAMVVLLVDRERAAVEGGLDDTALALTAAVDREMTASVRMLESLAGSPLLQDGDLDHFEQDLRSVHGDRPDWQFVALVAPDGRQVFNTARLPGSIAPLSSLGDRAWFRLVLLMDRPVVSPVMVPARGPQRASIPVAVPVRAADGALRYILVAFYDIRQLSGLLPPGQADQPWVATVIDRNLAVIGHLGLGPGSPAETVPPDVIAAVGRNPVGEFESTAADGTPIFGVFTRSALSGWTIALTVPEDVVAGPGRRLALLAGGGGILLFVAGLVVAALFGRRIARAIVSLLPPARALGEGQPSTVPAASRLAEVKVVADEISRASALLARREVERNEALVQLGRSEALHRGVIDIVHEIVWISVEGRFVLVNPFAAQLLGRESPAQLLGQTSISVFHPDDVAAAAERSRRVLAGENVPPMEMRLVRRDGSTVFVELKPTFFQLDGRPAILGIGRDLTARRQAQEELSRSEERFRDFADIASDWLWETGPDLRFTYISQRFEELIGVSPSLFVGKSRREIGVETNDRLPALETIHREMEARRPFRNIAYTIQRPGGRDLAISVSGRPIYGEAGDFLGYRGTGTDRTAEVEAERRLGEAQRMEAVGQLTGGIAHDFNNLLMVVLGNAEMLSDVVREAPLAEAAARIVTAAERGAQLTHRLLAFSRRQTLAPRRLDPNVLLLETVALMQRTLGEAVAIRTRLEPGLWPIRVDPEELENAILNLAVNARDAMPKGGVLTVETANALLDEDKAGALDGIAPGRYVTIALRDTGEGIAPDILSRVFEPFFTTKDIGKGSGLGLSMVYGFVRQSDGQVTVESEIGRGSVFRMYFPAQVEEQAAAPPSTDLSSAA